MIYEDTNHGISQEIKAMSNNPIMECSPAEEKYNKATQTARKLAMGFISLSHPHTHNCRDIDISCVCIEQSFDTSLAFNRAKVLS